ncbi:MAG: hypothetical protein KGM43_16230 [Planctomycetota bacterium]|nr:hypothetical protein [Planctomycetota bacterium]
MGLGSAAAPRALACPNCKEAVSAQPHELEGMARGYNYSVMFMLAVPFGTLGMGAFFVARAVKRGILPPM